MITDTISILELVWTLSCGGGAYFALRLVRRSVRNIRNLRARKINSVRQFAAHITLYTYLLIAFVQVAFVFAGIAAMMLAPANPSKPVSGLAVIVTVTFMLTSFVLSIGSYVIESKRRKLLQLVEKLEFSLKESNAQA